MTTRVDRRLSIREDGLLLLVHVHRQGRYSSISTAHIGKGAALYLRFMVSHSSSYFFFFPFFSLVSFFFFFSFFLELDIFRAKVLSICSGFMVGN